MKKFLKLICIMMVAITILGCGKSEEEVEEKEEKKDKNADIAELYYNFAKEFQEKNNTEIYTRFADVDSNGTIEMLFGYQENDENYATVIYVNDNDEVVNPGFIKGVNLLAHFLMDFDYKFTWFLFSGSPNNSSDNTFYSCIDLINKDIGAEKIKPISVEEIRRNYSFTQAYAYITKPTEVTLECFKTMYDSVTTTEELVGEEQVSMVKESIDKKRKEKENGTNTETTFKVGDYNVKFGKYKWNYPDYSGAVYYTLNSDYTCLYEESSGKKENCTFSVGIATDGQDISSAKDIPAILFKHGEYTRSYFPTPKGFRDTDLEYFEYIG